MTDIEDLNPTGVTRRRLLVRGAVLGGVAWAAPAVTTVGGAAFAASPAETNISFIALLLNCGGTVYRVKWDRDAGFANPESGPSFAIDGCGGTDADPQLHRNDASVAAGIPGTMTATLNADGSVTITSSTACTITDYVVKCGTCCDHPGEQGRTAQSFPATFAQCIDNQCGDVNP